MDGDSRRRRGEVDPIEMQDRSGHLGTDGGPHIL
jgi:hypothetical protein